VDAFVRTRLTIEVYRGREVDMEAPQVEAVSLVRAYVCVRIYALMATTCRLQKSLEVIMRPDIHAEVLE
jgi:hypothetical protein